MFLEVERMQYGVGQGCFHTQRISVGRQQDDLYKAENQFDFVYDCGSVSSNVGGVSALDWSIKHYRPKRSNLAKKAAPTVDALFVSHFHFDHISGIKTLCKKNKVLRAFVPFYTPQEVLAVLVNEAERMSAASDDSLIWFLGVLRNLTLRRSVFDIPTIYVLPDDERNVDGFNGPEIPPFGDNISVDANVLKTKTMKSSQTLQFHTPGSRKIWEIKVWHFKPAVVSGKGWKTAIALLEAALGDTLTSMSPITETTAHVIRTAATSIYKAMSAASAPANKNPNIVSMCVYSGPVPECGIRGKVSRLNAPNAKTSETHFAGHFSSRNGSLGDFYLQGFHQERDQVEKLGWLGTGDAMLERVEVWKDFEKTMAWKRCRAELVSTILMPHHGSTGGENYNPKLLVTYSPLALFSAGAFSPYPDPHPSTTVISDVLKHGCEAVNVTEFTRPGVFELVKAWY